MFSRAAAASTCLLVYRSSHWLRCAVIARASFGWKRGAVLVGAAYLALTLALAGPALAAPGPLDALHGARSRMIESRLLAPCCWNQTIDIHDSEVSRTLHREIAQRVARGEAADAIEGDLVFRYGKRIHAVPPDSELPAVALWMLVVIELSGIGLLVVARRWRNAARDAHGASLHESIESEGVQRQYDAQIERELADL